MYKYVYTYNTYIYIYIYVYMRPAGRPGSRSHEELATSRDGHKYWMYAICRAPEGTPSYSAQQGIPTGE